MKRCNKCHAYGNINEAIKVIKDQINFYQNEEPTPKNVGMEGIFMLDLDEMWKREELLCK